jgi:predicted dehydrogenase
VSQHPSHFFKVCIASGERILQAQPPEKVLMVAENAQYWREVLLVQRLIHQGQLGDLLSVRAT